MSHTDEGTFTLQLFLLRFIRRLKELYINLVLSLSSNYIKSPHGPAVFCLEIILHQATLKYAEAAAYLRRSSLGSKIEPMETEFSSQDGLLAKHMPF